MVKVYGISNEAGGSRLLLKEFNLNQSSDGSAIITMVDIPAEGNVIGIEIEYDPAVDRIDKCHVSIGDM